MLEFLFLNSLFQHLLPIGFMEIVESLGLPALENR